MNPDAKKILLAGLIFAVVYGLLNSLSNIFLLPSAPIISFRPQIALPMAVGILVHPLAGFITGFAGNVVGDAISGFGAFKFWNWHIANGLMASFPGSPFTGTSAASTPSARSAFCREASFSPAPRASERRSSWIGSFCIS
jgi:hypothetical protein